jgi:hypothetical protein
MFGKNWIPKSGVILPDNGLFSRWKHYVQEKNDRNNVHSDDDLWGINTQVIGSRLGLPQTLATSNNPEIRLFRQNLAALFQFKDLYMSEADAVEAYSEDHNIKNKSDLEPIGLFTEVNSVIDSWLSVTVRFDEPHFDYFFTLKLCQLDIMEVDRFLAYQLRESFKMERPLFRKFLSRISKKYRNRKSGFIPGAPVIGPDLNEIIQEKIAELSQMKTKEENLPIKPDNANSTLAPSLKHTKPDVMHPVFSTRQWSAMLVVALEALGLDQIKIDDHVSNVARLLHIILGKQMNELSNSEPYKKISDVFSNKSEIQLKKDFKVVRLHFQQVGWAKALEIIDLKIKQLEEKEEKKKKKRKIGGTPTPPPNASSN